jgi:predicted Zn-dependent protease
MKRGAMLASFCAVLGVALAAIYYVQRHAKNTGVSANAVLEMAEDAQRDLTRVPMQLTRISDQEEIAIGKELSSRYTSLGYSLNTEQARLDAYVKKVGATVAVHSRRRLPYEFHLIPDRNLINAFSLPGGPVYVGEGMLDLMLTEDELASVLGHEVEHIDHYHCVERVQVEAKLKRLDLDALGELLQIPLALWETGYNKDEELEADREGMFLAVAAGYSPYGAVKLFEQFAKLEREYVIHAETPEQELSELAVQSLEGYFRTHPLTSERLGQANRVIAEEKWEGKQEQRNFRIEYDVRN